MFVPIPPCVFGIVGLFTIMLSMTADICDLDELETFERREGLFGAIYWWMVTFVAAFAGLLIGLILAFVGFDQTLDVPLYADLVWVRAALFIVPATVPPCGRLGLLYSAT